MRTITFRALAATIRAEHRTACQDHALEAGPIAMRGRLRRKKGASTRALSYRTAVLCAALGALLAALATPAIGTAADNSVVGTWFASDLGPGGHAGGNLLADGTAVGSGELTFPTPSGQFHAHVQAVRWSALSPTTDGVVVNDTAGDTFCFVLPVTKGAPSHDIAVSFSNDCSQASPTPSTAGKVNPTP